MDWVYVGGRKGPQENEGNKGSGIFTTVKEVLRIGWVT